MENLIIFADTIIPKDMKKQRYLILVAAILCFAIPATAVFKEKNLPRTLSVLEYELRNSHAALAQLSDTASRRELSQHKALIKLIENCNELSLMLYSQQQDYTFDLTYALNEVTKQYNSFNANRLPYDDIVNRLEIELDRYYKLIQTLKNLPPSIKDEKLSESDSLTLMEFIDTLLSVPSFVEEEENPYKMDSLARQQRDTCLAYAEKILDIYWMALFRVDEDNRYYEDTDKHLKDAYDYAQERYRSVQSKIFTEGQTPFLEILFKLKSYIAKAKADCIDKYSTTSHKAHIISDWRGPMVTAFGLIVLFYILLAIVLSNIIVRLTMRWVKFFNTPDFRQHKLMYILLSGTIIFAVTVMIMSFTSKQNFIVMASSLLAEFAWLLAAIFTSMLIRLNGEQSQRTLLVYLPVIVMGLAIIVFRIIFIPNSLINIIFPPLLLVFSIWQALANRKHSEKLLKTDRIYTWISLVVMVTATVTSWLGYVMMALLIVIWWIFQLTVIQSITAIFDLMSRYHDRHLSERLANYRRKHLDMPLNSKGSFIEVTWFYDLVKKVVVPVAGIWSIPLCVYMAGGVFDLSSVVSEFFNKPLINVDKLISLSLFKLAVVVSLYFVFNYIRYAAKAFYRIIRTRSAIRKLDDGVVFKESDINFTLAENIISLTSWGLYIIISFLLLKIPTTALTVIATGLATGFGFAMKDVLNNFFYGVQLMSGRLRVGDVIECDGIRGTVDNMSYQTTQIVAMDGSVIAFPNSTLFAKNFKNLTRNHSYEMLKIPVGVAYGSDVDKVREVIINALEPLKTRDKYGREVVDSKFGIVVRFAGFGESSVDLEVIQFTTVDAHYTYAAKAKELIYNALNENGIQIPFPQVDIHTDSRDSL